MEDTSVAARPKVRDCVASPVLYPLSVGVGATLATATAGDLPRLPALAMDWASLALSARLYTAGSSIRPLKPKLSDRPMVSAAALASRGPAVAREATSCPLR